MSIIREDPRCSPRYLIPGKSYGGYCLPKDTLELESSIDPSDNALLKGVREINEIYKKKECKK
jgi:UDP-glucose 6-dehydrogenase